MASSTQRSLAPNVMYTVCDVCLQDGFTDTVLYPSGQFVIRWNPRTKRQTVFLNHGSTITAMAFNATTKVGASADGDTEGPRILLWDITTSDTLCEIELEQPLQDICFDQDAHLLAALEVPNGDGDQKVMLRS